MCQKNSTLCGPPRKRDPNTASASPFWMGSSRTGSSAGSYSRSASWTTTTSPVARLKPVRSAAPLSAVHVVEYERVDQTVVSELLEQVPRPVGRPVVHDDHFGPERDLADFPQQVLGRADLVVRRDDNGQRQFLTHAVSRP